MDLKPLKRVKGLYPKAEALGFTPYFYNTGSIAPAALKETMRRCWRN